MEKSSKIVRYPLYNGAASRHRPIVSSVNPKEGSSTLPRFGQCDFYWARETFLPFVFAMLCQKNSPLTPAINARLQWIVEAGLYNHWIAEVLPNATSCANPPTMVTVKEPLSLSNIWGLAVVWGAGLLLATASFILELTFGKCRKEKGQEKKTS
ncbi:uncharacterized protein [Macrobrachium rosenbergii]|uniref:uncharacterized protein isoform X3 n=1 Tax=Macrobrachium rosenbergii TaxID=79674 RepID=UPI0034D78323